MQKHRYLVVSGLMILGLLLIGAKGCEIKLETTPSEPVTYCEDLSLHECYQSSDCSLVWATFSQIYSDRCYQAEPLPIACGAVDRVCVDELTYAAPPDHAALSEVADVDVEFLEPDSDFVSFDIDSGMLDLDTDTDADTDEEGNDTGWIPEIDTDVYWILQDPDIVWAFGDSCIPNNWTEVDPKDAASCDGFPGNGMTSFGINYVPNIYPGIQEGPDAVDPLG